MRWCILMGLLLVVPPECAPAQEQPVPPEQPVSPPPQPVSPPADAATPPTEPTTPLVVPPTPPAPTPPPPGANQTRPGNPDTPCDARSDCREGLRCLRHVCVYESTFRASRASVERGARETDEKTRGYFGGALGFSLPALWLGNLGEGFQGALRLGVIVRRFQLQLEVAPGSTALVNVAPIPVGVFEASGTVGYLIPMSNLASWIIRFGGGGGFAFGGKPNVSPRAVGPYGFGEIRADLVGVAIHTSDHLLVELNAPSFRVLLFPGNENHLSLMWVTNVGLDYLF